jgi:broad specificity phosphatase PhoE
VRVIFPLNDMGRARRDPMASTLRQAPLELPLDAFDWVSSPLGRTRETMELVRTAAGLAPETYRTDSLLIELSFGDWEGQTLSEVGRPLASS